MMRYASVWRVWLTGVVRGTWLVCEIAFHHLLASRWKTLIIGGVGGCAALLIVVGSAALGSVDTGLRRSIAGSIAGDVHVYSSESKDDFEIMGDAFVDVPDLAALTDFAEVKRVLLGVPNVAHVVPMGFSNGTISSESMLDDALAALRAASSEGLDSAERRARVESLKQRVRRALGSLDSNLALLRGVGEAEADREGIAALALVNSAEFWRDFDAHPSSKLDFLDSRVAPLATAVDGLGLRYVGTDPVAFAQAFPRWRIVDGQTIPSGAHGFLFSKRVYEEQVKLKIAHGLDTIRRAVQQRHRRIDDDHELRGIVQENVAGVGEIVAQLDDDSARLFEDELQRLLGVGERDVSKLLVSFLNMNDANFDARYTFFYAVLAPRLQLYRYRIGDMLTIKTSSRRGYTRSMNVRLYGTYAFEGLEQSPLAGAISMLDLETFRELYGFASVDQDEELTTLRASVGAKDVERADVEALLFGGRSAATPAEPEQAQPATADPLAALPGTRARRAARETERYDPALLQRGNVLDVAVRLKDPERVVETIEAIEDAGRRAGLPLSAMSGEQSAGLLGQFVAVMRGALVGGVLVLFVVTLIVVSNALLMAALERVPELGALRAIGAQRRLVAALVLFESVALGLFAGAIGAGAGKLVLTVLGRLGVPAWSDVMMVVFSGERLYPTGTTGQLWLAVIAVVAVSCASGMYPAWIALRVSPRRAMTPEE